MNKPFLHLLTCSWLSIFIAPSYGQTDGYMFHGAIRDKDGNLWFATTGYGVYRYDAHVNDSSADGRFANFTERDGLCSNNVSSVSEDKEGNLWFNTDRGICRYNPRLKNSPAQISSDMFTKFTTKESLCPGDIAFLSEDRIGNFWFSTNGYGVCRYNPASGTITNFTKDQGLGSNFVQCMLEDKAGNLWLGERAGGVSRFDSATGKFNIVNGEGCFSNQIMSILEDKAGKIWFANLYQGLCRYDPVTGGLTHFSQADGLCHDFVTCLYEDKKGNLWLGSDAGRWGTGGGGVCRYNPMTGEATRFTEKDGLRNMNVWTIVEDTEGNIWVGCKGGLYRFHSPSGRFVEFTHKVNRK